MPHSSRELPQAFDNISRDDAVTDQGSERNAEGIQKAQTCAQNYWARQLSGLPHVHNIPLDRVRPASLGSAVSQVRTRIDACTLAGLHRLCQTEGVELACGLQAMLALSVARESGESDVVIGMPTLSKAGALVIRNDVAQGKTFRELLRRSAALLQEARSHASIPWAALAALAHAPQTSAHAAVFQIALRVDTTDAAPSATAVPAYDLTLHAHPDADDLILDWNFAAAVFDASGIERIAEHFGHLSVAAIAAPELDVWRLQMLSEAERRTVLYDWNATARAFEACTLQDAFSAQAGRSPEAIALSWRDDSLTYSQLEARANRLAHHLRGLGIAPGNVVGVCLQRSLDMVVGLLAILKAGCAYVPLDPNYPQERIGFMLTDSEAACVLVHAATAAQVGGTRQIVVDDPALRTALEALPATPPVSGVDVDALAYIIYTSGSTGVPKGVCIEHRQASAFVDWSRRMFDADALSGVLAATSICFDLSVFELFVTLCSGGRAVIVDNALDFDGIARARGLTLINTVPSAIKLLVEEDKVPASVRIVNLAGEALPPSLVREIYRRTSAEAVYNLYGPSEDTTYSTWALIARDVERVPIGRPIANSQAYVLDRFRQPVPVGVAGEIYVAGAGVARGYWKRPELTAERFLDDPFQPGEGVRMYRTGDLGRWMPSGELEYLGRIDHQIKLRGFRIELGEIQERLLSVDAVGQALVVAREDARGDKRLVAYLVAAEAGTEPQALIERCKQQLGASLPEYMLPSAFVVLDAMPLTPNGKVDRSALPEPAFESPAGHVDPQTPMEIALAPLWREILLPGRDVGANDDFFALGGHSLSATRMLGRVQQEFGISLPLKSLFDAPTLRAFADELGRARSSKSPMLGRTVRDGPSPLTYQQRQLWFIDQLDEGSAHYHMQSRFRIDGPLDTAALQCAIDGVVQRHEVLRSIVEMQADQPVQRAVDCRPPFRIVDATAIGHDKRAAFCEGVARDDVLQPFALARDAKLRATLVRLDDLRSELLLTLHHIAVDGWSLDVLMTEIGVLYRAAIAKMPSDLQPLPLQYADYAAWQHDSLQGDILEEMVRYWADQLAGIPTLHGLPLDRPRPVSPDFAADVHRISVGSSRIDAFQRLCRDHRATLSMGLQTLFAMLLARHSGERDIVVGIPVANREEAGLASLIGLFTNTVVMRSEIASGRTFLDLLREGRRTALEIYSHQRVPMERLVERLQLDRGSSHSPLTQIVFALQNTLQSPLELAGAEVTPLPASVPVCAFELMVEAHMRPTGLAMDWIYRTGLFDARTIERLAEHFVRLMDAVLDEPSRDVWHLPLLTVAEQQRLLRMDQEIDVPVAHETVHRLFERRCAEQPHAVAIVDGGTELSYAELERRAECCARSLRARGAGPGTIVAIVLERSSNLAIAALAVLKAGAAYLPIDPAYPQARIGFMLADSGAAVLITTAAWAERQASDHPGLMLVDAVQDDTDRDNAPGDATTGAMRAACPDDPAYVIYTSGSTGEPKGVVNVHSGLVNLCRWHTRYFSTGPDSRCTFMASVAFDASVLELWPTLLAGACLVCVDDDTRTNPDLLGRLLREQRVTHSFMSTGLLEAMSDAGGLDSEYLEAVSCGGDRLQAYCLPATSNARLVNLYGPTETTVLATAYDVPRDGAPLIGKPISHVRAHVVNAALQLQPPGVTGEICIGGACVGPGYLNADALTRERFIPDPFSDIPGARLYRTGDLARRLPDGNLEFIGRDDQQIKLRGFRIELGEIENRIRGIVGVRGAVVLLREDVPGQKRLVAYVITEDPGHAAQSAAAIRAELRAVLPEYMQPHALQVLETFPLTSAGKVDRQRLPAPAVDSDEDDAPATPLETALAALWAELLQRPGIGANTNFFEAGGHSLLVTRMIHVIADRLQVRVTVRDVFQNPTVRNLAEALQRRERIAEAHANDDERQFPLSSSQFRVWYLEHSRGAENAHNIPAGLSLRGALDADVLERALNLLVARHAMLRTRIVMEQGAPQQRTEPECRIALRREDLSGCAPSRREAELERVVEEHAAHVFDLYRLPLIAAMLVRLSDSEHRLQLNVHHIVFDGWSFGLFCEELFALYEQLANGDAPHADIGQAAVRQTYAGYVRQQREWQEGPEHEAQQQFWRTYLADSVETPLTFPGLRRWPAEGARPGTRVVAQIDADARGRLASFARSRRCSLFALLYSGFALLLSRLSGQDDFNIGIPVSGRHVPGVQRVIGNFLNNLPVRNRIRMDATFEQYLEEQIDNLQRVLTNQDLPFESILQMSPVVRSRDATPLFQVFFNMLASSGIGTARVLDIAFAGGAEVVPKFDLTMYVNDDEDGIVFTAHFDAGVFTHAAIEFLLGLYLGLLERIVAQPGIRCGAYRLDEASCNDGRPAAELPAPPRYWPGAVQHIFAERARRHPDALAIVESSRQWTYREVAEASLALAGTLRARGVGSGDVVAIVASRNASLVVGVMAVLSAGAAFSLLNPEYPVERVALLADILDPAALLFAGDADTFAPDLIARLQSRSPAFIASAKPPASDAGRVAFEPVPVAPDALACITFTSGTSGIPKAVAGVHIGLSGYLAWVPEWLEITPQDRFSMLSGLGHDPIQRDIFGPLCNGACLVVPPPDVIAPHALAAWLKAEAITFVHMTPTMAQILCITDETRFERLRVAFLTGEKLRYDLVDQLRSFNPGMRILNSYGTTETQRGVTYFETSAQRGADDIVPASEAAVDTVLRVLNELGTPCAAGEIGDLYLESHHLSLGYRNEPVLTAAVMQHLGGGLRRYRTGDVGCRLPGGKVAVLGRKDSQVNIRGFRIETGEIEAQACRVPDIAEAVVLVQSRDGADEVLVVYAVPRAGADAPSLRPRLMAHFAATLPVYMVPAAVVLLDRLPMTPNGKIDRQALPQPVWNDVDRYVAPRTPLEERLAALWAEVLSVERVGIEDDFFALGGHSMLMVLLLSKMRTGLGMPFHPGKVLPYSTIRQQAEALAGQRRR